MATLKHKNSTTQAATPIIADLVYGELAVNSYDGKVYTLINDGSDSVVEIGTGGVSTLDGGSASTVYEAAGEVFDGGGA